MSNRASSPAAPAASNPQRPNITIDRFAITQLFGYMDVDIPISDNQIVLVGVNGIGKSTVINILYYFLSRQWRRLAEFEFTSVSIEIAGKTFALQKADLEPGVDSLDLELGMPPRYRRWLQLLRDKGEVHNFLSNRPTTSSARRYAGVFNAPLVEIREFQRLLRNQLSRSQPSLFADSSVSQLRSELSDVIQSKILYLPTYRRIEKELRFIFPGFDDDDIVRFQRMPSSFGRHPDHYVELVSFGMEDVEQNIRQMLDRLKEEARTTLNALAGSYLRDVIRGKADVYERSLFESLDEAALSEILDRVEERTLTESDKKELRDFITHVQTRGRGRLNMREKYLAHFFSRLVGISQELKTKEQSIRQFATVCNVYLVGKTITYNDQSYSIEIQLDNGKQVELRDLSSGEKQIVSLFTHLYLNEEDRFIIIIDEPELSLSVPWQKRFLPDIMASNHCDALIAVTHSPFIYDNELRNWTTDLRRFITQD